MKNKICILLISLLPLISLGQIKRNIDGIVLGKTNKQEVVNYLKNKRIPYSFRKVGVYDAIICNKERAFAGISWSSTIYTFYKNKVFRISYSNSDFDMTKEEMDLCFENLSMSLQRKYSQFKKNDSDRDIIEYQDSNVGITLSREYLQSHFMIGIDYTDLFLIGIAFSEEDDDL